MDGDATGGLEPRPGGEEREETMETTPPAVAVTTSAVETPAEEVDPGAPNSPAPLLATSDPEKTPADDGDNVEMPDAPPAREELGSNPTAQTNATTEAPSPENTVCSEEGTAGDPPTKTPTPPPPTAPPTPTPSTPADSTETAKGRGEPIVIDDEEDPADRRPPPAALSCTEPDSEIKIANVTTLGVAPIADSTQTPAADGPARDAVATATTEEQDAPADMSLRISGVTSLQKGAVGAGPVEENGPQIGEAFSLNPEAQSGPSDLSVSHTPTFNPGRDSTTRAPTQNGDTSTLQRPDSSLSQSASFPRNQKQSVVDSPAPAASLPKPVPSSSSSSSSGSGPPAGPRTVKVTCANCRKPLKKGQTAYQRKGSAHLFCSTTCLSSFSHKPAPKKNCTMCKKDITSMKGTIVAQVDSSETFQEFCSTGCLASYESKLNPPKNAVRTKCTVCGKTTEIRHEVSFKNVTHKICSDACFNRYRMANGLIMNCCEQCGDYLPSKGSSNHVLLVDGQQKRFCSHNCIRDYKMAHGKMTQCTGCRAVCRSFDVTQCIGPSGAMEPYCSTACMTKSKSASNAVNALANTIPAEPTCHYCKRNSLPQYQATLPEGTVYNFCSSSCVTKFQTANMQTLNGQTAPSGVQLKCNYCRGVFSVKPNVLEWENKVYQFCSKACCDDYKKLHNIVTFCEYCQEERTLHETVSFSGVKRPFCSEGCKLLYKQDFARRLGLKCVTCNYCTQMCKRGVTKLVDNVQRDFCSEACAKKFNDWYYKALRCDCCKLQGTLTESVQWRAEMKHFCDQQCLLRFYCQQNQPNLCTQRGPENMALGYGAQLPGSKPTMYTPAVVSSLAGGIVKDVKNKAVLCKPLTMTKATEVVKKEYIPVPIPVPVYVPVPMNLYTQATPTSVTLPVPVPVPVFLPTTLSNTEQILHTISELKTKVPADPLEADLLTMAEMIAEAGDVKPTLTGVKRERAEKDDIKSESEEEEERSEAGDDGYQHSLDLEEDFPKAPVLLPEVEDSETNLGLAPTSGPVGIKEEKPVPSVRRRGHKRRAVERGIPRDRAPSAPAEPCSVPLRPAEKTQEEEGNDQLTAKPMRLKRSLPSLSVAELNCGLARFVSEARRPNGDHYAPDSIFYLCLGIQQHLRDNGRTDDIFGDPAYQRFGQELNKVLKGWRPSVLPDGSLWGRVEEQALWSCSQLGEHSPTALLRSLVYLNTKYLGLRTVEEHQRLSFSNVYGIRKINPHTKELSVCLRVPSIPLEEQAEQGTRKRKRGREEDDDPDYYPDDDSGSCPVTKQECLLYELYLSKCPTALKHRTDVFYMKPEISSCADSPLWYTSTQLENTTLESLLTQILLVRDVYDRWDPSEDEGEEEEEMKEEDEAVDGRE
ncbi:hypothetical protein GJAV_G00254830 [Gymnothorax javanicus]|nr:hypothetical protein GJAV_G00254830 [Gymnothorax javanicus]